MVSETGSEGLSERLVQALSGRAGLVDKLVVRPEVSVLGMSGSLGHIELSGKTMPLTLRQAFSERLSKLERKDVGLLVTIDEAQAARRDDMVAVATAIQHLVSEDREVAIVFAGLPNLVSDVLNDDVLTFMRRAKREILFDVPIEEVSASYQETFESRGMMLDADLARRAAEATYGYPYMVQLVGYNIWDNVVSRDRDGVRVTAADVGAGIAQATIELDAAVCEPELAGLSAGSVEYLEALARFDGPAHNAAIAEIMGKTPQYAGTYRRRLLDAHVLFEPKRGEVDFALPYLRDYLRRSWRGCASDK